MAAGKTPHDDRATEGFHATAVTEDALQRMERGLGARKPLLLLTGGPGTGKSTLAREALRRWRARVTPATLSARRMEPGPLAAALLAAFDGKPKPGASPIAHQERLIESLANASAGGRVAVLVVDDAHELPDDAVLELARLADRAAQRQCPLEVLLVGEPSLAARFESPDLAGASDDVSTRVTLAPLSAHDTRHHLLQRSRSGSDAIPAQFSRKACRDIHALTLGALRDIEAVAAEAARVAAGTGATTVSPEHVRAAWKALGRGVPDAPDVTTGGDAGVEPAGEAATPAVAPDTDPAPTEPAEANPATVARSEPAEPVAIRPSGDPRVKDWVSRFGGSGVNIGGHYAGRRRRDLADLADAPRSEPAARSAAAGATAAGAEAARAQEDTAATWSPLKLEPGRHMGVPRRRDPAFPWQVATLVMGLALVAVLVGQRRTSEPARQAQVAVLPSPAPPAATVAPEIMPPPEATQATEREREATEARPSRAVARSRSEPRTSASARKPDPTPARATSARTAEPAPAQVSAPPAAAPAAKPAGRSGARTQPASRTRASATQSPPAALLAPEEPAATPRQGNTRYAITVATFDDPDRARAEKKHVGRLTRHRVWVSTIREDGRKSYRLQLGTFRSRDEAAAAAQSLLWQGVLREAQVVELPE